MNKPDLAERVSVQMTREMRNLIKAAAVANSRSESGEIYHRLSESFAKQPRQSKPKK